MAPRVRGGDLRGGATGQLEPGTLGAEAEVLMGFLSARWGWCWPPRVPENLSPRLWESLCSGMVL